MLSGRVDRDELLDLGTQGGSVAADSYIAGHCRCKPHFPADHPLLNQENVILTPHSAALTEEALYNMSHMVTDEVERALSGKAPLNKIN